MLGTVRLVATATAALPVLTSASSSSSSISDGVIAVPLIRNEDLSAYFAKVEVGTPPQTEYLKIDTGSPRYSFLDPANSVCATQGNDCKKWGTFDNTTSSTCQYEAPYFSDALGSVGRGDYLSDTITIGGVSMEEAYFGYTSDYSFPDKQTGDINTILGLSLECQFAGPACSWKFSSYLLPELKNASKINHLASSIYLGPDDKDAANAKMLLGGAYDRAKITGDLFTVPMVDPFNATLSGGQTNSVNVTKIEVIISDDGSTDKITESFGEESIGVPVLIDTGVASFYLTDKTVAPIYRAFGGISAPPRGQQFQVVDCKFADSTREDGYIAVEFGPHGTVKIPLHALVSKFPDSTCGVYIAARGENLAIFGDPFLRGVYSIFDQENFSITFGHVKHTDEEEIVSFPEGGFKPRL